MLPFIIIKNNNIFLFGTTILNCIIAKDFLLKQKLEDYVVWPRKAGNEK